MSEVFFYYVGYVRSKATGKRRAVSVATSKKRSIELMEKWITENDSSRNDRNLEFENDGVGWISRSYVDLEGSIDLESVVDLESDPSESQ